MSVFMPSMVCSEAELKDWIDFPSSLYEKGRYVPSIRQHLLNLYHGKTPYNKDGEIQFMLIRDENGKVLARCTLHESAKFNAKLEENVQLFGFAEFVNDYAVFSSLMDFAIQMAHAKGKTMLFGSANLLPNQSGGVIQSGYEERSFVDSVYNLPYYSEFYQRYGFEEAFPANTYICRDLTNPELKPDTIFPFDDSRLDSEKLVIHRGSRKQFASQLPLLHKILNDSFSTLGYYTNISLEELRYQVDGLDFLLEEDLLLYLTRDDEVVAFVLCIPDISEYIMKIDGNLNLLNQLRLFIEKSRYRQEAVLIIKGTDPSAWGQSYMNLLSRELLRNIQRLGYHTLRTTWVEDHNKGSASQFLKMGGKALNRTSFYKMALR